MKFKEITVKLYLIGLKKPLTLILDNETQLDKLDLMLNDSISTSISFGCVNFSRDKFICYTIE